MISPHRAILVLFAATALLCLPACSSKEKTAAMERERAVEYALQSYFSTAVVMADRRTPVAELPLDTKALAARYPGLFSDPRYVQMSYAECRRQLARYGHDLQSLVISIMESFRLQQPEPREYEAGLRLLNAFLLEQR